MDDVAKRAVNQVDVNMSRALRDLFIKQTFDEVKKRIYDLTANQTLVVQQEDLESPIEYIVFDRDRAAEVYEKSGVKDIAHMLREEARVPGVYIVCYNAHGGHRALMLAPTNNQAQA